jgi:DNA polymerase/3'-5' exonuclease PolX
MKLEDALPIAKLWVRNLEPYCDRIEIAGSIRRQKPDVKDIEIVCIPKESTLTDLFGATQTLRVSGFAALLSEAENNDEIIVVSGKLHTGKYIKIFLKEYGIKIDLFTATKDNWGHILAIRTGSADYSHRVLAHYWVKAGYHSIEGQLTRNGVPVPVREERDLFDLIGIEYTEPWMRSV